MTFRLLFIGDVVGRAGCDAVRALAPELREELGLDAIVANGENSAPGGRGITQESGSALLSVVDFLTLGNHAFDAQGGKEFLKREERVARPENLAPNLSGRGWGMFEVRGVRVGVANVLGRVFIDQALESPFSAVDRAVAGLEALGADLVLVDVHAEATSEKQAMGYHLAGRAQAVVGTHTHVPTADASVLPGGTAYATDVGMTGSMDSVIGFNKDDFMNMFLAEKRVRIEVEKKSPVCLRGVLVDVAVEERRALGIRPVYREWST